MSLQQKLQDPNPPLVLYEDLPPRAAQVGVMLTKVRTLSALLSRSHVDAVNIPEIRAEACRGIRPVGCVPKMSPLKYGNWCQKVGGVSAIVYRCAPYHTMDEHRKWAKSAIELGIKTIVVVGRESHEDKCEGPEVCEAIRFFCDAGFTVGGVMIPHREFEQRRLWSKSLAGASFFVSQVLFDSPRVISVLDKYVGMCAMQRVTPKRVVLSFAPVTSLRNLEFMEWLGVKIPKDFRRSLVQNPEVMIQRSRAEAVRVLIEVLEAPGIVPLGLNVEHVLDQNVWAALALLRDLSEIYRLHWMARGDYSVEEAPDEG